MFIKELIAFSRYVSRNPVLEIETKFHNFVSKTKNLNNQLNKNKRVAFCDGCSTIPDCLEIDNNSYNRMSVVCVRISNFTFMSDKVNRYKLRLWGSENPHFCQEHTSDRDRFVAQRY